MMSPETVSAGGVQEAVPGPAGVCRGVSTVSGTSRARSEAPGEGVFRGGGTREAVTMIMGVIVGLIFLFGFGNVLSLGLRLGVSGWVAPLVAPAVDLSVLALLLGDPPPSAARRQRCGAAASATFTDALQPGDSGIERR
jgi:hypothetical protein